MRSLSAEAPPPRGRMAALRPHRHPIQVVDLYGGGSPPKPGFRVGERDFMYEYQHVLICRALFKSIIVLGASLEDKPPGRGAGGACKHGTNWGQSGKVERKIAHASSSAAKALRVA